MRTNVNRTLPLNEVPKYTYKLQSVKDPITYRPFLVKEEKVMLMAIESDKEEDMQQAITDTVQACVYNDIDVSKLPIYDFEMLYLQIRSKSVGEIIKLKLKCPDDDKEIIDYDLKLDDVKLSTDTNHNNTIEFSKGYGVVLDYPTISSYNSKADLTQVEVGFKLLNESIKSIFKGDQIYDRNSVSDEEVEDFVNNLTQDQYKKLMVFYDTMPRIRHKIEYQNPKSGKKFSLVFNGASDFF